MSIKEKLKGKFEEDIIKKIPRAFDIVGEIAIIKLPKELENEEPLKKEIAKAILDMHKHVKSVFLKKEEVSGTFRIAKHEFILGENKTETLHKEYGCIYKLDINKVYFNFRLGEERLRVARQIRKNEKVLVMFAGIGCFAISIAKHANPSLVIAIELNPDAFKYMQENIKLNKVENKVIPILGDVKEEVYKVVEKYGKFDRILMPLPKDASSFLKEAKISAKKGAIIHFYTFAKDKEEAISKVGEKVKILNVVKCGEYAPFVYRFCVEFIFED